MEKRAESTFYFAEWSWIVCSGDECVGLLLCEAFVIFAQSKK